MNELNDDQEISSWNESFDRAWQEAGAPSQLLPPLALPYLSSPVEPRDRHQIVALLNPVEEQDDECNLSWSPVPPLTQTNGTEEAAMNLFEQVEYDYHQHLSGNASNETLMPTNTSWGMACHPQSRFESPSAAQAALNEYAKPHGYAVVVKSSINAVAPAGFTGPKIALRTHVIYGCDRHGTAREHHKVSERNSRPNVSSRRCQCPMQVWLVKIHADDGSPLWQIEHRGTAYQHNHAPSTHPTAHPDHRRASRTDAVRKTIATDAGVGVLPASTLARLARDHPSLCIVKRDIYNERQRSAVAALGGKSRIEFLLSQLEEGEYFVDYRVNAANQLTHLFFAENGAIKIYRDNPDVLLMDCTYRTNRYNMPLLNIVGVTGMNTTIHVAQVFLHGENTDDYSWAMYTLKRFMIERQIPFPQVIFTDRDLALIQALRLELPVTPALLYVWHIIKDVETHARKNAFPHERDPASTRSAPKYRDSAQHRAFCDAFLLVIRSTSVAEYESRRLQLHVLSPSEAEYVDDIWVDIWKISPYAQVMAGFI